MLLSTRCGGNGTPTLSRKEARVGLGFKEKSLNPTVAGQFSKEVGAVRRKMAFFIGQDFVRPLALRTLRRDVECGTRTEVPSK